MSNFKKAKKALGLFLSLALCFAMSMPVFAKEQLHSATASVAEENQPRIGTAGYTLYRHSAGSYAGSFTVSCSPFLTMNQYTVKTSGFNSNTTVSIEIFVSDGIQMSYACTITGNGEKKNLPLLMPLTNQTYTVNYYIGSAGPASPPISNDDGTIEVWLY